MNTQGMILPCQECGTRNRVPEGRLHDHPVCGKCHAPLAQAAGLSMPVIVTDLTFRSEVLSFPGLVVVDCWAAWCGPCRMVAPIMDQLAAQYSGKAKIAKLNVDENPATASQFSIRSIPTMLFFKNGKVVKQQVGALPKAQIEGQLQSFLE